MTPITLLCLPFAGGGASYFRQWPAGPEWLRVRPVQLPGREERFAEPPYTDAGAAMDEAAARLAGELDGGPVALFGHSLGAVLAYELAHRLVAQAPVTRLIVSGSAGPWTTRSERATGADDDEFLARVRGLAAYSHPALRHPELLELLLPVLRADVRMHEDYRPSFTGPLPVPITAVRGRADDLVDEAGGAQWAAATTAGFTTVEVAGGHMYLAEDPAVAVDLVTACLGGQGVGTDQR